MNNNERLINDSEITDSVIDCLKFVVDTTRKAGGTKEMGIKGYEFTLKEFTKEANDLVKRGYLSRMMIFADRTDNNGQCNLAGEQGTKNISGLYYALTEAGLDVYHKSTQKQSENK